MTTCEALDASWTACCAVIISRPTICDSASIMCDAA